MLKKTALLSASAVALSTVALPVTAQASTTSDLETIFANSSSALMNGFVYTCTVSTDNKETFKYEAGFNTVGLDQAYVKTFSGSKKTVAAIVYDELEYEAFTTHSSVKRSARKAGANFMRSLGKDPVPSWVFKKGKGVGLTDKSKPFFVLSKDVSNIVYENGAYKVVEPSATSLFTVSNGRVVSIKTNIGSQPSTVNSTTCTVSYTPSVRVRNC